MSERVVNRMWKKFEAEDKSQAGVELGWRQFNADLKSKKSVDKYSQDTDLYPEEIERVMVLFEINEGLIISPAEEILGEFQIRIIKVDDTEKDLDRKCCGTL